MYLQMMQQASLLRPACCTSWAWARAGCSSPRATPVHFESQEARVSFRDSSGRRWPLHTPVAPSARMGCRIRLTHAPQPAYEYAPSHSAVSRRVPPTRRALDGACPPFSAKDPLLGLGKGYITKGALVPTTLAPTPRVSDQRLEVGSSL